MSKRITLNDFEIEQLISGLTSLRNDTTLDYEVIKAGKRFYDQLIDKLKNQNQRSVETLGLSGHGDDATITRKRQS